MRLTTRMLAAGLLAFVMGSCGPESPTAPSDVPEDPASPATLGAAPVAVDGSASYAMHSAAAPSALTVEAVTAPIAPGEDAEFRITASPAAGRLLNVSVEVNEHRTGGVGSVRSEGLRIHRGATNGTYTVKTTTQTTRVNVTLRARTGYTVGNPGKASVEVGHFGDATTWPTPGFRVDASTATPRITWNPHPSATGYTVEFRRPISWTGRKDNGYAEMSNPLPPYAMRAKAHVGNDVTEWTDWFITCRPPDVRRGGDTMSGRHDESNECVSPAGANSEPASWPNPNLRVTDAASVPRIEWDSYPGATGYTVQFSRPIEWTGRKNFGYAQMYNPGPGYTMRVKAHLFSGAETAWTDWFNTCRPPSTHAGGPSDPPDCE